MDPNRSTRKTKRPDPQSFLSKLSPSERPEGEFDFFAVPDPNKPDRVSMTDRPWYIMLVPVDFPGPTLALELHGDAVIGSSAAADPELDVTLAHWDDGKFGVSRRHCKLRPTATNLFVIDLHSTNGTYVNGMLIAADQIHPLKDGDLITLGQLHVKLSILEVD